MLLDVWFKSLLECFDGEVVVNEFGNVFGSCVDIVNIILKDDGVEYFV